MKNTEYKNFEHALKPYYNYTEKEEKEYSYFTDSLYLLNPTRALELFRLGLPVYMLNANGWQSKVRDAAQLIEGGYACGIEKKVWPEFLHTDKGEVFVRAWSAAANIARHIKNDFMANSSYFVELYYEDLYIEETNRMDDYFEERYLYSGNKNEVRTNFKANSRVYLPLVFEYGEILREAFLEAGEKSFDKDMFSTELLARLLSEDKA